jgi:transcriptional regulator with XRE-family HTH domain
MSEEDAQNLAPATPVSLALLGEVLIAARKERRLTQQGLAERLGSHQEAVARMERDRYRSVSLERLVKVAEALEVSVLVVARQGHGPAGEVGEAGERSRIQPRR